MAPLLHPWIGRSFFAGSILYSGGWLGYYLYTDTARRLAISERERTFERALAATPHTDGSSMSGHVGELEKELLTRRWSSLKIAGRFVNPAPEWREQGLWEWLLWKVVLTPLEWVSPTVYPEFEVPEELERVVEPDWKVLAAKETAGRLNFTWIGQSTSYVQLSGLKILTDPIFSDRTLESPPFYGPRRLRPTPCELSDLPGVDVVLVSHNHFDHLDVEAVSALGNDVKWFVPLGVKTWFTEQGVHNVTELDWWHSETVTLPDSSSSYKVTATPAMHWSGRTGLDTNTTLWAGFHVEEILDEEKRAAGKPLSLFHAGDTGYSESLFKAIGAVLGPVTLAAIPIGSYGPRWHLQLHHTDPEGAVNIARSVGAKYSFGVHWGTWVMSDEPPSLPPTDVELAKARLGLAGERDLMRVVNPGRTIVLDA